MLSKLALFDQKIAIVDHDDRSYTYDDLIKRALVYQKTLLANIPEGSSVAILSDYNFEAIALFSALYEKKAIITPITSTTPAEINERIAIAQCLYSIAYHGESFVVTTHTNDATPHPML